MSIVIDMEMPKNCCECDLRGYDANAGEEYCPFSQVECLSIGRQKDCPIKAELPAKHGRLIDADDVKRRMIPLSFSVQKWIGEVELSNCKTVIEAEGEA